jgi:glycosyltransferase involved in cell wall biosynthesis
VRLSIVVPAFNEERLIASTLEAIRAAARCFDARGGWELIVCDNNSTDRTEEIARSAGAKVVFEPHNQISRARNRGAAVASGEWLLFVDADSAPSAELFLDLQRTLDRGDCLAGGSTIAAVGPLKFRAGIRAWNALSRAMSWAAGSFIFCRRDAFSELGGFSEELYAAEELELFGRLKRLARARGERIVILRRHPLRTSARKVEFYGRGELLALLARIVLHPHKTLRSREACGPWYDGRR